MDDRCRTGDALAHLRAIDAKWWDAGYAAGLADRPNEQPANSLDFDALAFGHGYQAGRRKRLH